VRVARGVRCGEGWVRSQRPPRLAHQPQAAHLVALQEMCRFMIKRAS
jgi:hypothetical protein